MWAVLCALVLSLMSYLLLTDKELSLLDQTEMLYIVTSLSVGRALLAPIGRGSLVAGKIWAVLAAWLSIFAISAPYILVVGAGSTVSAPALIYTFALGTLCVAGFAALLVGLSALLGSGRSVTLGSLAIFVAMAAPTLLGTALQKSWFGAVYN